MHLHIVEQLHQFSFPREGDYSKPRYLDGLEPIDRLNLERVVDTLKSGMPSDTRILAVGSSVLRTDGQPMPYNDLDIMLFGSPEITTNLGLISYIALSGLADIYVDKRYLKGRLMTRWHQMKKDLDFRSGLVVQPETGKTIDVFISAVPLDYYFERSTRPYVVLH